jgi:hypothetical protein
MKWIQEGMRTGPLSVKKLNQGHILTGCCSNPYRQAIYTSKSIQFPVEQHSNCGGNNRNKPFHTESVTIPRMASVLLSHFTHCQGHYIPWFNPIMSNKDPDILDGSSQVFLERNLGSHLKN